ncbi:hypothetical protein GWG65_17365 [Bradyrhizobium sp. CSA207]|uniref:hypothetical protein n=1 Tax=Bradyrhizobium sp. CSA207 TaxID=2698826 RepID=UPI0023B08632|nr:hypothetical protein [Bradyrhizobium sp. CSA207]MDE5443189.1 hypothetical protein [Bradyrhizobium sp. CSA207]
MAAMLSNVVLPVVMKRPGAFYWLLSAACDGIVSYLARRSTIACLHGLDDCALQDIGLVRLQIETSVTGLFTLSGQADERMTTFAAAMEQNRRHRKPTAEVAQWS